MSRDRNSRPAHDIALVVRGLAYRVTELCERVLPDGRKEGHEWVAGPPGGRVRVHLTGAKAGVWAVFASTERGDALDLVAYALYGGDKKAAWRWALNWLGLDTAAAPEVRERIRNTPAPDAEAEAAKAAGNARKLWLKGKPLPGTPAAAYLAGRGLDLAELGKVPGALRFHPTAFCAETGGPMPAMLGMVRRFTEQVAVHRTYLAQRPDGTWGKAKLDSAKKVLGLYRGGFIPLWRGASGKPIAEHPEGDTLAIAEGIEDALTVALHQPTWRVIAAISVSNFAQLQLPPSAIDLVLVWDRDGENPHVRNARKAAERALLEQGRSVRTITPEQGFKDFNEWHQALRAGLVAA